MVISTYFTLHFGSITRYLLKISGDTSALEDVKMMQLRDHIVARKVSATHLL